MDSHADLIQNFVARSGTRFVVQSRNGSHDSCETFYFAGANAYYLVGIFTATQKQSQMSCVTGHISRAASIQSS